MPLPNPLRGAEAYPAARLTDLLTYFLIFIFYFLLTDYLYCEKDGRDERHQKNGLAYTTTSADGRAIALLSLSGSSKGKATLCWRLSVQKNPKRRRGAFPGVQHMGGVVDKGCG